MHPEEGPVPFAPTRRKIDDVLDALRAIVLVDSAIDPPTWIDDQYAPAGHRDRSRWRTGCCTSPTRKLLPHTPTFFSHHALPFPFLPDAAQPDRWMQFLNELWPDDPSSIACAAGSLRLHPQRRHAAAEDLPVLRPEARRQRDNRTNPDGLLGAHHVAAPTLASLSTNFGLQPLVGKPLALVSDARLSSKADSKIVVERLLSVSGEDSLTIDRKYRDPWTGRLPARFVILTNELPRLTDSSGALASRFILFVLTKSFYGSENPALTDELLDEAPGIFNWALVGLDRLTARGFFLMPESGRDAVQQLEDLSSPVSAFIRDRCKVGARWPLSRIRSGRPGRPGASRITGRPGPRRSSVGI